MRKSLLLFLLWLAGLAPAWAAGPAWKLSYCSDPRVEQLSEALACNWQVSPPPRQGWGETTRWMRLRIDAAVDPTHVRWALEVKPHFLGQIELHQRSLEGRWQTQLAGNQLPGSQPFAVLGGYRFPLSPQPQEQWVYLKVRTQNIQSLGLEVSVPWQAGQASRGLGRVDIGLQLGLLAMVAVFAVISFALNPQVVMGRFALSSLNMLLGIASGSGLLALTWLQDNPALDQWLFNVLVCIRLSLWIWVSQALLHTYAPPGWFGKACGALHAVIALAVALVSLGLASAAYLAMVPALLVTPVVLAWAAWQTQGVPKAFKRVLVGGFCLSGSLILLVLGLALLPPWAFDGARYAAWLTDFANPLVMLLLVLLAQRSQLEQLKGVEAELMRTRLQSDFDRQMLTERQVLIDMLVHELKNPLASISLALSSLFPPSMLQPEASARRVHNIRRSIHDMTNVLERCTLMNSLEQAGPRWEAVDLTGLLQAQVEASGQAARFALHLVPAIIRSDPDFVRLVVSNLLENALKYSPAPSIIEVRLRADSRIELQVRNVVQPDMQPDADRIFSRYYRHERAQQVRGTGLGLFLVREICRKIDAQIRFKAEAGSVTFTVEWPQ